MAATVRRWVRGCGRREERDTKRKRKKASVAREMRRDASRVGHGDACPLAWSCWSVAVVISNATKPPWNTSKPSCQHPSPLSRHAVCSIIGRRILLLRVLTAALYPGTSWRCIVQPAVAASARRLRCGRLSPRDPPYRTAAISLLILTLPATPDNFRNDLARPKGCFARRSGRARGRVGRGCTYRVSGRRRRAGCFPRATTPTIAPRV